MRIPQTPPDLWTEMPRLSAEQVGLMATPVYSNFVRECQERYRHWDKVRRMARDRGLDPIVAWIALKLTRRGGSKETPFHGEGPSRITYTIPDVLQREIMLVDQQLAGTIGIGSGTPLNEAERDRYIASALMDEAIASSMLEGAATTAAVAKEMLRSGRRPRSRGEKMVANNFKAIEMIRGSLRRELTPEMLLELQTILTIDTLDHPDQCGRLRREEDSVRVIDKRTGDTLHDPPPADELHGRLARLCSFANARILEPTSSFIHPFVRACLLHFMIGFDHPFCDGNGRTARTVFYWSMLRDGYWLFEFLPVSRLIYRSPSRYGQAYLYAETDDFDSTYFLVYNARIIQQAREELRARIAEKRSELSQARRLFRSDSQLSDRQNALLMHAVQQTDAIYTIESHQRSHGVAYATARADLLDLAERGYLRQSKRGNRFEFVPGRKLLLAKKRQGFAE